MVQVTRPRRPPCPFRVKILKNLLLWNQMADDLETLYAASGARVLKYYQVCSNDDPVLTLTYFTARSNLVPYAFEWEKGKQWIFKKLLQSMMSKLVDAVNGMITWTYMNIKRSRSLIDLGPRSVWFNILFFFSLKAAKPIEAKFHVYPSWDGRTKYRSNGPGHMTNIAAIPRTKGRCPGKLVCSIGYTSTTKFVQTMTQGWPWLILSQGHTWYRMLLYEKKVKQ